LSLVIDVKEKKRNVFSFALSGSIDTDTHKQVEETIKKAIGENTKALFLEMGGVDSVSGIGIRAILMIKQAPEAKNVTFAMVDFQPRIKKIFDVMKLLPIFEIFDNMPDADKYIDQIIEEETSL